MRCKKTWLIRAPNESSASKSSKTARTHPLRLQLLGSKHARRRPCRRSKCRARARYRVHDRHSALRDEACERFIVERHKVFEESPTTAYEQHFFSSRTNHRLKPRDKIGSSLLPLLPERPRRASSRADSARRSVRRTSCTAAPRGEVTRPIVAGYATTLRLRAGSIRPSFFSMSARLATCARRSPSPASLSEDTSQIHTPLRREYR